MQILFELLVAIWRVKLLGWIEIGMGIATSKSAEVDQSIEFRFFRHSFY